MKFSISILAVLVIGTACSQQPPKDYQNIYNELCNQDDDSKTIAHLKEWEENYPRDPEMFISAFNFYLQRSKQEVVRMDGGPAKGQSFQIMDSTNSEPVGYLYGDISYDEELFKKSIDYLTRGLTKNPKRLDMHFGKIITLGQRRMFEEQTSNILQVLDYGMEIEHKWLWKLGEPIEDGIEAEKSGIQDYVYNMFNQQTPACDYITTISNKLVEVFPDDIFGYSNIGACNLMNENFDEAITWFKQAEIINKQDPIVLSNIAYAYMKKDMNEKAIEYYNKVASTGDEQYKNFALQKIEELKE
ncbi:tetratricopeptide repeat protein [Reichenbachiella sp.]|uniref:tetratricopeptide repeat protein n=1 Tax=Reichenbachiella sp. TaxID=2184521 RepID=UPI003BAF60D7